MAKFKDAKDREWIVEVNVSTVRRVRSVLEVDLLDAIGGDLLQKLAGDAILLADVLYVLVKPQADAAGVTDEDFGAALFGDAIERAAGAILEGLVSFCRSPKDRANLKRVLDAMNKAAEMAREVVSARLDADLDRIVGAAVGTFGASSTSAPASPESAPTPSPSGSSS